MIDTSDLNGLEVFDESFSTTGLEVSSNTGNNIEVMGDACSSTGLIVSFDLLSNPRLDSTSVPTNRRSSVGFETLSRLSNGLGV